MDRLATCAEGVGDIRLATDDNPTDEEVHNQLEQTAGAMHAPRE